MPERTVVGVDVLAGMLIDAKRTAAPGNSNMTGCVRLHGAGDRLYVTSTNQYLLGQSWCTTRGAGLPRVLLTTAVADNLRILCEGDRFSAVQIGDHWSGLIMPKRAGKYPVPEWTLTDPEDTA